MLSITGLQPNTSHKPTRRRILQAAGAGLLGLSVPKLFAAEQRRGRHGTGRAKSVIFMFLFGGPSQLETFDMKPDAPDGIRGPCRPIASRTPGLRICEHLPQLANVSNKFCVLRTLTHNYNDHSGGGHYLQTGRRWHIPVGGGFDATSRDWPSMGSVVEYLGQRESRTVTDLPYYAVVPNRLGRLEQSGQYLRPGEYAGWLGRTYNPLTTTIDKRNLTDNPYWRNCTEEELRFEIEGLAPVAELNADRTRTRQSLLEQFDNQRRAIDSTIRRVREHDRFMQRAMALATSARTRRALDIRQEPETVRDRYGRHLLGQSSLMARRLVEAGVRFVTIHYDAIDGYSWDSHVHSNDVRAHLLPTFDQSLAALLGDLDQRGLLDETLVVALGEMGRTPAVTPQGGRQHWSTLFPVVLAGAGVRGGTMVGASDRDAAYPIDRPTTPEDLAATIYHALGIDPDIALPDAQGRPTPIVDGGRPVREIFG